MVSFVLPRNVLRLLVVAVCAVQVLGATKLAVRKEWRSLTKKERTDYIDAVKCLQKKPAKFADSSRPGVVSRFDDLVYTHILHTRDIHVNGQFLPWHRYFTYLHEVILRDECGYTGYQPYWDQTLDLPPNGQWVDSPLFDPETGFGGNGAPISIPSDFEYFGLDMTPLSLTGSGPISSARGNQQIQNVLPRLVQARTGGGCITDGPFKKQVIRLGPSLSYANNERCLNRDFTPGFLDFVNLPRVMQGIAASPNYQTIIGSTAPLHGVGHGGVGGILGEMWNLFSSPNDPLFFVHHANLDRVWWNWQAADLTNRLKDMTGPAGAFGNDLVTLNFMLDLAPLGVARPISDVMDIRDLGYTYAT